ncbi:cytochrome P450 family protein [Mycobacterium ulcerans str. Harvey]|uniref:Cytochrome P450 family protein n=1 Tax=Mycobacterium ulcerans str. Harvey TaxID=1299332 RepID=A0ABN0R7M1_MYCUL|nr:cytochrome P450 family protein [Mycobacterium ulcerans str. Harvey]
MAWSDTYGGHWVAAGSHEVFELARCPAVSNDHDVNNQRRGYKGISIPTASRINGVRAASWRWTTPSIAFIAPC